MDPLTKPYWLQKFIKAMGRRPSEWITFAEFDNEEDARIVMARNIHQPTRIVKVELIAFNSPSEGVSQ